MVLCCAEKLRVVASEHVICVSVWTALIFCCLCLQVAGFRRVAKEDFIVYLNVMQHVVYVGEVVVW